MNKILVMGGAGYIGSHTVKKLKNCGYETVVVDNLVYGHREAVLSDYFYEVDMENKDKLSNVFKEHKIDAVIHFAAYAYVGESVTNPAKYYRNNVSNTINLLDVMRENGVGKIVFSSTCATYGNPEYTPLDENHPQNPVNPYGQSKLMVEKIFSDYARAYGLKYAALRYFNAAGCSTDGSLGESHTPETHLIPLVLKAVTGERPGITIFGTDYDTPDGTCIRDYIHVEDLADAHILALEKLSDEYPELKLNLGTGVGTSVKEIVESAKRVTGKDVPVILGERREGDPAVLYASNDKAKKILNWEPKYMDIDEIVKTAWNWEQNKKF